MYGLLADASNRQKKELTPPHAGYSYARTPVYVDKATTQYQENSNYHARRRSGAGLEGRICRYWLQLASCGAPQGSNKTDQVFSGRLSPQQQGPGARRRLGEIRDAPRAHARALQYIMLSWRKMASFTVYLGELHDLP